MFNWNKISEWKNKAGDISVKMKDFAKDLITLEEGDLDDPFTQSYLKTQQQSQQAEQISSEQVNQQIQNQENQNTSEQTQTQQSSDNADIQIEDNQSEKIVVEQLEQKVYQEIVNTIDQKLLQAESDTGEEKEHYTLNQTDKLLLYEDIQVVLGGTFKSIINDIENQALNLMVQQKQIYQQKLNSALLKISEKDQQITYIENKLLDNSQKLTQLFEENSKLSDQFTGQGLNKQQQDLQSDQIKQVFSELLQQFITFQSKLQTLYKIQWSQLDFENDWKENIQRSVKDNFTYVGRVFQKCDQMITRETKKINESQQKLHDQFIKLQEAGQQISKREQQLQNDNLQLQKKLVDTQDKLTGYSIQYKEKENRVKELEKLYQDWDKTKREFVEEIKSRSQEIDQLKLKLKQKDQEVAQNIQQNQQMQQEYKILNELKQDLLLKEEEIERLQTLLEEWQQENQQLQQGIQNIQLLNEQEELKRKVLQNKYEGELRKARMELEQHSNIVRQYQEMNTNLESIKKQYNESQKLLSQNENKFTKLEQSNQELESEIQALHKKVKTDQQYQQNTVDRRVVSKFMVNYFDSSIEFPVKMQILETLASILQFTEEEKEKVGCFRQKEQVQQQQQQYSPPQMSERTTLKDKFIGFLMND